jgi:hypothetical protein
MRLRIASIKVRFSARTRRPSSVISKSFFAPSLDLDLPDLFEKGEDRIDRTRTRRVAATEEVLDGLDQLIAMPRLLADQRQQHESKITRSEDATASASATTEAAPSAPNLAAGEIRVGQIAPMPPPMRMTLSVTAATHSEF